MVNLYNYNDANEFEINDSNLDNIYQVNLWISDRILMDDFPSIPVLVTYSKDENAKLQNSYVAHELISGIECKPLLNEDYIYNMDINNILLFSKMKMLRVEDMISYYSRINRLDDKRLKFYIDKLNKAINLELDIQREYRNAKDNLLLMRKYK